MSLGGWAKMPLAIVPSPCYWDGHVGWEVSLGGYLQSFSMIPHQCLDTLSHPRSSPLDSESAFTPSLGRRVGPRLWLATMLLRYRAVSLVGWLEEDNLLVG